ncbi:MAG TPA: hypothetical protein EYN62_03740 [Gammaproteobacteria bacterium]|nr:hypothetical protein [Gammaproteobacteria bacterium]
MILEGFKFTNSLFLDNFTKFFIVIFPIYVIQFLVYLAFGSVPGNEFGTSPSSTNIAQQFLSNLLTLYSYALAILLIDDIFKEKSRSVSNYFYQALYFFPKIIGIGLITGILVVFGLLLFILPGLYISARLMFAPYIGLMENRPILDSVKKAYEITEGKGWKLIGYVVAVIFPIIIILITILTGFAVFLIPENINAYMAIAYLFSFLSFIYLSIYIYRLLIDLNKTEDESI